MRLAISAAIAALMASTAAVSAADLPMKAAPYVAPAPIFSWTGFYIGVNAGIGGDKVDYPFRLLTTPPTVGDINLTSFGGFGGVQGGYNWQAGNWVLGVEADVQATNMKSQLNASIVSGFGGAASLTAGTEMKYFGTARGRVGYAFDRLLVYGTGGYAFGSEDTTLTTALTGGGRMLMGGFGTNFSRRADLSGWTAGGGVEWAWTNNISFKTEYLFLQFDRNNVFTSRPAFFIIDDRVTAHTLKFGLNYKFGWGGPVVARY